MEAAGSRKWKVCCVSDTHGKMALMSIFQTEGDLFIHAGDFTQYSKQGDLEEFCKLLDQLKYRHKVVVSGNHELCLDHKVEAKKFVEQCGYQPSRSSHDAKQLLKKHCTYLEHESVTIEGVRIFGSPYTIKYSDSAFQYEPEQAQILWSSIPADTDILITHSPPYGTMDIVKRLLVFHQSIGCKELARRVKTLQPKLHVFGHVHDSTGIIELDAKFSVNGAQELGKEKGLKNRPFLFEIDL